MRRIATLIIVAVALLALSAGPTDAKTPRVKHPKITSLGVTVTGKQIKMSAVINPKGGQTTYKIYICPESEANPTPVGEGTVTAGAEPREVHASNAGEPSREHLYVVRVVAENEAGSTSKSKRIH